MRCETSFFSLTLYQKHLRRGWPIWAVWLAGWLLAIPVTIWNTSRWNTAGYMVKHLSQEMVDPGQAMSFVAAVAAPIVAVTVFFHLYKAPAANFVGGLPLRREGTFATGYLAGYTMLAAPLVLVSLVTILVEAALGAPQPGVVLRWLGASCLICFFWFSFATLCCVISGSMVASVSFYVIFNGVVMVMVELVEMVLGSFLYGFAGFPRGVGEAVEWLTPFVQIPSALEKSDAFDWEFLFVFFGVGILMTLLALGLHHIRKAERAGDLVAFVPLRYAFKYSVTLCGGLSLGLLLAAILFNGINGDAGMGWCLAACCAVMAVVSYFVAEMLLQKTFWVFRGWKGALISALCFLLAILAIDRDWIGFTTRIPTPSQVESATAVFYGEYTNSAASGGLTYDSQSVAALTDLHRYLVEHRSEKFTGDSDSEYYSVEIAYDLGAVSLRREYSGWTRKGSEKEEKIAAAITAGVPSFAVDRGMPDSGGWICLRTTADGTQEEGYQDLTPTQLERVWAAVEADVSAGRYRADLGQVEGQLEFTWVGLDRNTHQTFWITEGCAATRAVLAEVKQEAAPAQGIERAPDVTATTEG